MIKLVQGSVLGFCIGDALGVPVEFVDRGTLKYKPVVDMRAFGVHGQQKGTWSDDSSLLLCTMESLLKGYDIVNLANTFLNWLENGHLSARGRVFDVGFTTIESLKRIKRGIAPLESGNRTVFDNGNGSLMRILPFIFYLNSETNTFRKFRIIGEVSGITHGHIVSKIACSIYVEMGINILRGSSLKDSYKLMKEVILKHYINKPIKEVDKFSRILKQDIRTLNEKDIKSTGYVLDTLEAVFWCLLNSKSYKEAVLMGINLGEDTDTIGALIGGLAGLYYGIDSIPGDWITTLARKDDIVELCSVFANKIKLI